MDTPKFPKSYKVFLPLAALVVALTLCMPRTGEFEYHYTRGAKWNYKTLVAPFSFPILKTEQQLRDERESLKSSYVPYYRQNEETAPEVSAYLRSELSVWPGLSDEVARLIASSYDRGIAPDDIMSRATAGVVFVQRGKRAVKTAAAELYTCAAVRNKVSAAISSGLDAAQSDSLLHKTSLLSTIVPDLFFDEQTTFEVQQQSSEYVSPTSGVFKSGDVIVSGGELITADIEQILDSYKAEFKNSVGYKGSPALLWLGNFLISLILSCLVFMMVLFIRPKTMDNPKELTFILSVFFLCAVISFIMSKLNPDLMVLVPYPVFALYYMSFFRKKMVLPLYALTLLPMLLVSPYGILMYVVFLVGGFAAVYAFSYFYRGYLQFVSALFIFVSMVIALLSFRLMEGVFPLLSPYDAIYLFLSALFCILAYPLVYLFEIIFSLVSASRLVDLSDTSQPLLRLLAEKAPGTFQHSLEVMNMADACARAIDANIPLIRAGALYHDIGKTENPLCFIENQLPGVNYHEGLSPKESAAEIIEHVTSGMTLAEKYGLPKVLRSFIQTHHGTSTTGYFYNKFVNDGGNPDEIGDFSYPGPNPSNKEQVILMMCDSAEASSRTLKDYSMQSVSKLVEDIYRSKYQEGLFDEAAITLREIETVKETIKTHIVQMHHGRVVYPKRKK